MKENKRKCLKCGSSPAEDCSITLYRFPKPGKTNIRRCELWAKYCFPQESWNSHEFQTKLFREHRMLCHKHFKITSFYDFAAKRLNKFAAPDYEPCDVELTNPVQERLSQAMEPIAGPSWRSQPFVDISNTDTLALNIQPQTIIPPQSDLKSEISAEKSLDKRPKLTVKETYYYNKCRKHLKNICQLRNRIKKLKNESILKILSNDKSVHEIIKCNVTSSFALLLQEQLNNTKKKAKGRRWNSEAKIIALRLYKRSPTCYRLLRRLFCLPAPSILKYLLCKFNLGVGINKQLFEVLKKYVQMFDEMSIKKNLFYNRRDDIIEGFQDHASQGRTPQIASYVLVFMIAGIRKKVKQPIAYYFSGGSVTADK